MVAAGFDKALEQNQSSAHRRDAMITICKTRTPVGPLANDLPSPEHEDNSACYRYVHDRRIG